MRSGVKLRRVLTRWCTEVLAEQGQALLRPVGGPETSGNPRVRSRLSTDLRRARYWLPLRAAYCAYFSADPGTYFMPHSSLLYGGSPLVVAETACTHLPCAGFAFISIHPFMPHQLFAVG